MSSPILEVDNLFVEFRTHEGVVKAVNGLSYQVRPGETLGIVGESGSGKSVSSMAVMGLLPRQHAYIGEQSSIKIDGKEISKLPEKELRKYRGEIMSMIFQDPMTSLNPYRRVDDQMIEALRFHRDISKFDALKIAQEMLEFVHIPEAKARLKCYPHELSGGMRQRVMIAMALTCDPKVIFADEPTTALDVTVQSQIMKLFKRIQKEFNTAIILISHDLGVISTQCDNIIVMYGGQKMEEGTPEQIFENTRHPYTKALKESIPDLYPKVGEKETLKAIQGLPPNMMTFRKGCPFEPRCEFRTDQCLEDVALKKVSETHTYRCVLEEANISTNAAAESIAKESTADSKEDNSNQSSTVEL